MNAPTQLVINGRLIQLILKSVDELDDCYGQWLESDQQIEYRKGLHNDVARDTVLHEVFHAIRSTQGRPPGGKVEEDYVCSLASGLIGVLNQNPQFAEWLISKP